MALRAFSFQFVTLCCGVAGLRRAPDTPAPDTPVLSGCRRENDTHKAFSLLPPAARLGNRSSGGVPCGLNHSEDLYRPIPEVLASRPGIDGYCYFECHAPWLFYNGQADDYASWGATAVKHNRESPLTCPDSPGIDKGPLVDLLYFHHLGPVVLHSYLDCQHMETDDVYCYALGWLQNQGVDKSLMADPIAWRALANKKCDDLQLEYNFTNEEITLGRHIDDRRIFGGPERSTMLHAYHKCLLGHAAEEMAYCMSLGCLLPDDVVGHGGWCEKKPPSA